MLAALLLMPTGSGLHAQPAVAAPGLSAAQQQAKTEESPWPNWINVYVFPGGFCAIDFTKFSTQPEGSYYGAALVLSSLQGWEKLPANGTVWEVQTGQSVGYSVQRCDFASFASSYEVSAATVQAFQNRLQQDGTFYMATSSSPLPDGITAFLNTLGQKFGTDGLAVVETKVVPPVWRSTPLKTEIKRLSVEEWNRQAGVPAGQ